MWKKIEDYIDNLIKRINKKTEHWNEFQNWIGFFLLCGPIVLIVIGVCLFVIVLGATLVVWTIKAGSWWMFLVPSAWLYYHLWSIGCFSTEDDIPDNKDNDDEI